ncbi:truncayed alpha-ketoglutarate transport protein [Escherichia coli]|uniref:Truncayed alpha-ketoglutarate transport protein n=1 Tax=Escherichia coli TaxID=562 RepID=A0A376D3V4_ECOLX|nr:truncayed alpha-ketoglutarate transport protein [Escherichia coli]
MFPAQVRALGVGLSYAVANAIFGWVGGVRSVVAEINRNGNSLLLVCDLDGRGGVSGFTNIAP